MALPVLGMQQSNRETQVDPGVCVCVCVCVCVLDEFRGHALLQAAREADVARVKKHLTQETLSFKHPLTHETALVRQHITPSCGSQSQSYNTTFIVQLRSRGRNIPGEMTFLGVLWL